VSAVASGALAAIVIAGWGLEWDASSRFLNALIAVLAVGLAAEWSAVKVQVGSSTVSVAFIPYLAAVLLFSPFWAMLCAGITLLFVEAFVRRKPTIKVVFNVSKEILTIALAAATFRFLGGVSSVNLETLRLAPVAVFGVLSRQLSCGRVRRCALRTPEFWAGVVSHVCEYCLV
jgi:hypothetical protein